MRYYREALHKLLRTKTLILLFYLLNLGSALIVALPFRSVLGTVAGHSFTGGAFASGFDAEVILELMSRNTVVGPVFQTLIAFAAAVYGIGILFFSGGVFGLYLRNDRFDAGEFWNDAGRMFPRYLRLFLLSLPVLVICYCIQFLETAFVRIVYGPDPYQTVLYWGVWIRTGLGYLGLLIYAVIFDYARIFAIDSDERNMRRALGNGIRFVFRHFLPVIGIALPVFLAGLLLLILYNLVTGGFPSPSTAGLIVLICLQQAYIAGRVKLRLILYAVQTSYFARKVPETPEIDGPSDGIIDPNPLLTI